MASSPQVHPYCGFGERIDLEKFGESLPSHPRSLAASSQPLLPGATGAIEQRAHAPAVPVDAEVVAMTVQFPRERGVLRLYRLVSVAPTPVVDGHCCPSLARLASSETEPPKSAATSLPIGSEAEEIEGGRSLASLFPVTRASKWKQPGLIRMQFQAKPLESLTEHRHHTPRVVFPLETDREIIRVTDETHAPAQSRAHFGLEPDIQHVV